MRRHSKIWTKHILKDWCYLYFPLFTVSRTLGMQRADWSMTACVVTLHLTATVRFGFLYLRETFHHYHVTMRVIISSLHVISGDKSHRYWKRTEFWFHHKDFTDCGENCHLSWGRWYFSPLFSPRFQISRKVALKKWNRTIGKIRILVRYESFHDFCPRAIWP